MDKPEWLKNRLGSRLLDYSENGYIERVIENLESGANIDYRGGLYNQTALMLSSSNGHYDVVKLLLENGADPNITDSLGNTALIYSVFRDLDEKFKIVKILLENGADPNLKDNDGDTAFDIELNTNSVHTMNIKILNILRYYMNIHHIYYMQRKRRKNLTYRKKKTQLAYKNLALSKLLDTYDVNDPYISEMRRTNIDSIFG